MKAVEVLESLELIGTDQWGLVTSAQAHENGISRLWLQRLNDRGVLQRLRHGVYALPSSQPGFMQDVQAAWLSVVSASTVHQSEELVWPAVVSGATAAAVHEIGDLVPPFIELSVPSPRMSKQRDLRLVHRSLPEQDLTVLDGLPVTTVERTIHDLSTTTTDLDHLTALVVDAAHRPDVSVSKLSKALDQRARTEEHTHGLALLENMLSSQGLTLDLMRQKNNFGAKTTQLIAALLDPKLSESIRAAMAKDLEKQQNFLPGLLEAGNIMQSSLPDLSLLADNFMKIAASLAPQSADDDHHNGDQDDPHPATDNPKHREEN